MPGFLWIKSNTLISIAYLILATMGMTVRPESSQFSLFMPATGFALAACVYLGNRVLPGIVIGALMAALLAQWQLSPDLSQLQASRLLLSAALAIAHPLVGRWLLEQFAFDRHNFDDAKELLKIVVVCGPFAAAINIALTMLAWQSLIGSAKREIIENCLIAWGGLSLGVFVMYPVNALLFKRGSYDKNKLFSPLILQFGLACVAVVFIFSKINQWENDRVDSEFQNHAQHVVDEFKHVFEREAAIIYGAKGLFVASDFVSRREFDVFAAQITKRNDSVAALEWVPNISKSERSAFLIEARGIGGLPDFAITEKNELGQMRTAAPRERYFPIYYIYPFNGNERALGFDLASNPIRFQTLLQAAAHADLVASPPLRLVQGDKDLAILIFEPVYKNKNSAQSLENVLGFTLGVFRIDKLFAPVLRRNDTYLSLQVIDAKARQVMYQSEFFTHSPHPTYNRAVSLLGRDYLVNIRRSQDFAYSRQSWLIILVSALGFFILGIFTLFLLVRTRRGEFTERLVRQQTAELRRVNLDMKAKNELLASLSRTQSDFISHTSTHSVFKRMITDILQLTASRIGFVVEILRENRLHPTWRLHAACELAVSNDIDSLRDIDEAFVFDNFHDQINAILITGQPLIELESGKTGDGDLIAQSWQSFLAIPIYIGFDVVGIVGLAGRCEGYDQSVINYLDPFIGTCSNFIHATHVAIAHSRAEANLLEQESRLRAQFDNVSDTIISFDHNGIIESVNPAGERLSGYRAEDLIGRHIALLFPDCGGDQARQQEGADLIQMKGLRESKLQNRHAELLPVEISTNKIELPDSQLYCSVVRDLSERHKINRMKKEFVATVSHELRTPLTSVQGALKLINSGLLKNDPAKEKELLQIAQNNTERLLLLVNDLLDMEKIESGKLELYSQSLDLMPLLRQAQQQMESYAQKFDVELRLLDHPDQAMIEADPNRLAQVIANLLSNAIKFTDKDTCVELSVEARNQYYRVMVRDYGPGITESFKQRIFNKFTQADGSSSRKQAGSGLGLSICKQLIELMGGKISFYAAQPGTVFYVDIPKDKGRLQRAG